MFAGIRIVRRATRHRYSNAMGDGSTLPDKSLVRLYAGQNGLFAEGWSLGGDLDRTAAEIRVANGRISNRQPLGNALACDTRGSACWAAYTEAVPGCRAVIWRGIQRIHEDDCSSDQRISCGSWNVGFRGPT